MKFIKIYAIVTTSIILVLSFLAFKNNTKANFETITVQRINVVEPDGKLDLVISNSQRMPDVVLQDGTILRERTGGTGGAAGMIFYNYLGEEAGGLTYSSLAGKDPDGNPAYRANSALSFDQFRQDQVVDLGYNDNGKTRDAGLTIVDRPSDLTNQDMHEIQEKIQNAETEEMRDSLLAEFEKTKASGKIGAYRVFVGSDRRKDAVVRLFDKRSNPRLLMKVDSAGNASIEFLDVNGAVLKRITAE